MAATVSVKHNEDYFSQFKEDYKRLRKSHGMDVADGQNGRSESILMFSSSCPDRTISHRRVPLSPCVRICSADRLLAARVNRAECASALNFILDLSRNGFMPGICGAGVTWCELPMLHVNLDMYSQFVDSIRKCMYKHVQPVLFCREQSDALVNAQHPKDGVDAVEYFCGLPERGALPKISIGVRHISAHKYLVVSVDSYWQPAQRAFESTLKHLVDVLRSDDDRYIEDNAMLVDAMIASLTSSYAFESALGPMCDGVSAHNDRYGQGASGGVNYPHGVPIKERFRCAGVEYMNAMSVAHRTCVLTKVLRDIREYVRLGHTQSSVIEASMRQKFGSSNTPMSMPTLSQMGAALDKHVLCGENETTVNVIDPRLLRHAVHSTIRIAGTGVYAMCRQYALDDVRSGRAHVNFGDIGQGMFYGGGDVQSNSGITLTHAFAKKYDEKEVVYPSDYTPVLVPISSQNDNSLADIVVPEWRSSQGVNFTACDIAFLQERSALRSSVALVVPMQEYYNKIEPMVHVYTIADASGLVPAFQKYFSDRCSPKITLNNIIIPEPLLTLVAATPIEYMSISEIVQKAEDSMKKDVVISPEHVAQMYARRVPSSMVSDITRPENVITYGPTREYYRISVELAKNIVDRMQ